MVVKIYTQFQKITNLIRKLKKREFIMQEEEYTKVQSKIKVEILFMVLLESNLENFQFQDPLEIFRPNFLNMTETLKF